MSDPPRRLGRPASSSSAETRSRILDTARRCFAEQGFGAATNRTLADEAGITTGAIYHYFESKVGVYTAVYNDVQARVYEQFGRAVADATGFVAKLEAVLDAAHELNRTDPTLAVFLGSARVDLRRHPELAAAVRPTDRFATDGFFARIVDVGIETGEIRASQRNQVTALIITMTIGLTDAVSGDIKIHRDAVDAIKALLEGTLITTKDGRPAGSRRSTSRSAVGA
jgi:AcrR family transcriptional regulator